MPKVSFKFTNRKAEPQGNNSTLKTGKKRKSG
jgi:hypothetical protein